MDSGPLIVDNGTGYIKIGYAGVDAFPRESIASVVGKRVIRADSISDADSPLTQLTYYGNEAMSHRNQLELTHVLGEGIIRNWEYME